MAWNAEHLKGRPADMLGGIEQHALVPDIALPHQGAIREEWLRARPLVRYLHMTPGQQ
jgi:hypothetical protein